MRSRVARPDGHGRTPGCSEVPVARSGTVRLASRTIRVPSPLMATAAAPAREIQLDRVAKRFGEVTAVDEVTLDIAAGEFFSLLGPSGCGKTTTLRMIGGFELPTSGRILLRDRDVTRDPPDKRAVNMVFQHYALFPHLTVGDNIAFGPKRQGLPKDEIRRRVGEGLALVRLDGYEKRKPNQLSGGQQQRVALARALANRPNVLLLDEPLGALDLKLRRQLQVELKRIQSEVGITFIYVTHDQEEALTMSDRIAVMNAGRVEQLGTPEELYERPRTRFVADFIGTSNFLSGAIESVEGLTAVVRLAGGDRCVTEIERGLGVGHAVELSVRPEAVVLRALNGAGPTGAVGTINAAVEQAAYLGGNIQYLVRSTSGLALTALAPTSGDRIPVGGEVEVTWSPGDALVLAAPPVSQEELTA
jgi:spermidine/putrescine transport system ATP-binding protein